MTKVVEPREPNSAKARERLTRERGHGGQMADPL